MGRIRRYQTDGDRQRAYRRRIAARIAPAEQTMDARRVLALPI